MGCIQSYFRKAATGSSQASPTDVVKHIVVHELSKTESSEASKVPIVAQEEFSPLNDVAEDADGENAERRSLHYVEATAVRELAANTSSVAILGTTVTCNEIDYRRSVHSDQALVVDARDESVATQKDEQEPSEKELKRELEASTPSDAIESTNIVTTAIIEVPPSNVHHGADEYMADPLAAAENMESSRKVPSGGQTGSTEIERSLPGTVSSHANCLPKVVQSIEKSVRKDLADAATKPSLSTGHRPTEREEKRSENAATGASEAGTSSEVDENEREPSADEKTNGNSEKESTSSEVVSVVKDTAAEQQDLLARKRASFESSSRPNRLSLGQQSIESDQNTLEISSADDVVKNESTDVTSPESLKESFEECLIKGIIVRAKIDHRDEGESSKEENAKEISNTSLNTLGNDSEEDGSDLEVDICTRKTEMMKRFDTISSNGESSYRMEEHNYPSVTEEPELEEYVVQQKFGLESTIEEVFDDGDNAGILLRESVRESAINEVNKICDQAIEKTTDILIARTTAEKDGEDANNVSESSVLSVVDSVVAEKGSDFDSLSFVDEQSDSRSVSVVGDDSKSCKSEVMYELHAGVSSPQDAVQKRLQESEQSSTLVIEDASVSSQDISGAVITQENRSFIDTKKTPVDSISEDLPKPPNLEDFPPLPENLDQFDITEDELKAVQLPGSSRAENISIGVAGDLLATSSSLEAAASKIQAGVRGYLTRKQIRDVKNEKNADGAREAGETDVFDMSCTKNYIKSKRLSLDSKLGDFENIRKLPKLKSTLSECVEEEGEYPSDLDRAAAKIQSSFRHYRARKSICLGDRSSGKLLNGESPRSAVTMTRLAEDDQNTKNELDSDKLADMKSKFHESDLQPLIEENRIQGEASSAPTDSNETAVKMLDDDDPLKQAAVRIQATYRGFKTRRSIQISATAATKIQAHFRGYKVRKTIKHSSSLNDLRNSASSSCSNVSSQQDLERRVTKIQAGVRGYLVRKRHSLQNSAAIKIQLNYRKYKSRKEMQMKPSDSSNQ